MLYTKENLMNCTMQQLIDIVLQAQDDIVKLQGDLKGYLTMERRMDDFVAEWQRMRASRSEEEQNEIKDRMSSSSMLSIALRKRGRKAYTPEEKEAAYQKQLENQKRKYYEKKEALKKEEENGLLEGM